MHAFKDKFYRFQKKNISLDDVILRFDFATERTYESLLFYTNHFSKHRLVNQCLRQLSNRYLGRRKSVFSGVSMFLSILCADSCITGKLLCTDTKNHKG